MPNSLDAPHGYTLAALKGLAISSSFLFAGHLSTVSLHVPALYLSADYSHRVAAQQFASQHRAAPRVAGPAAVLATGSVFAGLAYLEFHAAGPRGRASLACRLWAGAAAAVLATLPWTALYLDPPALKLLWVSEVADSATKRRGEAPPAAAGVTVKVDDGSSGNAGADGAALERTNSLLGLPADEALARGAITPIEDFEPFEDAIIGEEYEQLKVKKLLQMYDRKNFVKTVFAFAAGALGLAALFVEA